MPELILESLKGKKNFDELFKAGLRYKVEDLLAVVIKNDSSKNNPSSNRIIFYAVAISKRTAKKAVVRNRIKRLMRESLRLLLKKNPENFEVISQMILMWRNAPKKPAFIKLSDVMPIVEKIVLKVNR
jgi:ribonuclease P protein component